MKSRRLSFENCEGAVNARHSTRYSVTCVALSLISIACGTGTPFRLEDTARLKPGMTEAEVTAIMGRPYSRSVSGRESTLVWNYASHNGAKALALRFENDRLV